MNKDLTLVILAGGMGSRFGGLKQIEPMGPNGEFIIDYSIYDAIKAGFTKVVFLIGLEEGIFPHMNSLMESSDVEEERRLMYVAITRAKDDLHLINARRRTLFGKEQINPTSRFLNEIPKELLETNNVEEEKEVKEKVEVGEMFREEDVDYQVGDFVYHETFGTGKVVEVTNTLVSVAFKHPHGIKKLMKNHKKLSKV